MPIRLLFFILACTCVRALILAQDADSSWLRYPAISPDGNTIAFSYQGDIYTVPTEGGDARPLTIGEDYAYRPSYSPDGTQLSFASDRHGNFDVFVMDAQGGPARRLTYHSGNDYPWGFSADGGTVYFTNHYQDPSESLLFPSGAQPELYGAAAGAGDIRIVLPVPAEEVASSPDGRYLYYHDNKGYENRWRKHHTSSIARDLWRYDTQTEEYLQLTDHEAEDRDPVVSTDGQTVYFLSERGGDFNVYRMPAGGGQAEQITRFEDHPVRFLTISQNETLSFSWHGGLYTLRPGGEPQRVDVSIRYDGRQAMEEVVSVNDDFSEAALSPNGKEYAYIFRGEIFVSSVESGKTRRLTNTAHQERSLTWFPDGRRLAYAAEINGSWDILQTKIAREEEPYFFASTLLETEALIDDADTEEFQPVVSPDGKKIAYLKDRSTIMVWDSASREHIMVLGPEHNYSYSDGDMHFAWSPDSRYLVAEFGAPERVAFFTNVALLDVSKENKPTDISMSGYGAYYPAFSEDGSMVYYYSVREGHASENNWPSGDGDIYGIYLTRAARDSAAMTEEELTLAKEAKAEAKAKADSTAAEDTEIELTGITDRKERLTERTDNYGGFLMGDDAEKLFVFIPSDGKYDLHQIDLRKGESKQLADLNAGQVGSLQLSDDGKKIFLLADKKPVLVTIEGGDVKRLSPSGEMLLKRDEERAYIFEHAWRQLRDKFYVEDLQGVDWAFYHGAYEPKLASINNNYDFAEMLSEMLGETNASHTGSGYRHRDSKGDKTAALGLLFDLEADGLVVDHILRDGPLDRADSEVAPGYTLTAINGEAVGHLGDLHRALNRRAGDYTLLTFIDPAGEEYTITVKPIGAGAEGQLTYERWVRRQRALVDSLSGGKLGYVHVRGMNNSSMKDVIDAALGRHIGRAGLVVDTRFNGGGNLHDRLSTFLNGEAYADIIPHGQYVGSEPLTRWNKPSVVLVGESNYSDAHIFPVAYRLKDTGKTVGMPVPGTGTFVWWETQIDPTLYFGIPMGGWSVTEGEFLENTQFEPDVKVRNAPDKIVEGKDEQTEVAVRELLEGVGSSR